MNVSTCRRLRGLPGDKVGSAGGENAVYFYRDASKLMMDVLIIVVALMTGCYFW